MAELNKIKDSFISTNAAALGQTLGTAYLAEVEKNAVKIKTPLTPAEAKDFGKTVSYNWYLAGGNFCSNDHRMFVAWREGIRICFEKQFHISTLQTPTLMVGCSAREVYTYSHNPNISYGFHNSEGKDMTRFVMEVVETLYKKLRKEKKSESRVMSIQELLNSWSSCFDRPIEEGRIGFYQTFSNFPKVNVLVMEDSCYNYSAVDYDRLFTQTGASVLYGYAMLPYELVFPDMLENPYYSVQKQVLPDNRWQWSKNVFGATVEGNLSVPTDYAILSYKNGFCNSYAHPINTWAFLLRTAGFRVKNQGYLVELCSRSGPMMTFKIIKGHNLDQTIRVIELPPFLRYVKVCDIYGSVNHRTLQWHSKLDYFVAPEEVVLETLGYLASCSEKVLTLPNVMLYVHKMMKGLVLSGEEYKPGFRIPATKARAFAITMLIETLIFNSKMTPVIDDAVEHNKSTLLRKFMAMLKSVSLKIIAPIHIIYEKLKEDRLTDKLILWPTTYSLAIRHQQPAFTKGVDTAIYMKTSYEFDPPKVDNSDDIIGGGDDTYDANVNGVQYRRLKGVDVKDKIPYWITGVCGLECDKILLKDVDTQDPKFDATKFVWENVAYDYFWGIPVGGVPGVDLEVVNAVECALQPEVVLSCECEMCRVWECFCEENPNEQKFKCVRGVPSVHRFHLDKVKLADYKETMRSDRDKAATDGKAGLAKIIDSALDVIKPFEEIDISIPVDLIIGPPGCGKSYFISAIYKNAEKYGFETIGVVVPFKQLHSANIREGINYSATPHYALLDPVVGKSGGIGYKKTLVIDEFTALDYQLLCAIVKKTGAERVILVGDPKQTGIREDQHEGLAIKNHIDLDMMRTHQLVVNFRNPYDTVIMLRDLFGYDIEPCKKAIADKDDARRGITYLKLDEYYHMVNKENRAYNKDLDNAKILTYASATFSIMTGKDPDEKYTCRSNQGMTYGSVKLFVTQTDNRLMSNTALSIVGLSRHTERLYVVYDDTIHPVQFAESLQLARPFIDKVFEHVGMPVAAVNVLMRGEELDAESDAVDILMNRIEQPPNDAYLDGPCIAQALGSSMLEDPRIEPSINYGASHISEVPLPPGVQLHPDAFLFDKKQTTLNLPAPKYYSLGGANAMVQDGKNTFATFKSAAERSIQKKPMKPLNADGMRIASAMVHRYFSFAKCPKKMKHLQEVGFEKFLADEEQTKIGRELMSKLASSGYMAAWEKGPLASTSVHFTMKTATKPETTTKGGILGKLSNPGQGISAWSKDINSNFMALMRAIAVVDMLTDRKDDMNSATGMIYQTSPNGKSIREFCDEIKNVLNSDRAKYINTAGLLDQRQFDWSQDCWTQFVEKLVLSYFGIKDTYIVDFYYANREKYGLGNMTFFAFIEYVKASGEPGTLLFNTIIEKIFGFALVRPKGTKLEDPPGSPIIQANQGDDGAMFGENLEVDQHLLSQLTAFTNLQMTCKTTKFSDTGTEFCGYVVNKMGMFPNIKRKYDKTMCHRFKDYKTFTEYQVSLRDYCDDVKYLGVNETLMCTSANSQVSVDLSRRMWHFLESLSHINEEQFYGVFQKFIVTTMQPTMTGDGSVVLVDTEPLDSDSSYFHSTASNSQEYEVELVRKNKKAQKMGASIDV